LEHMIPPNGGMFIYLRWGYCWLLVVLVHLDYMSASLGIEKNVPPRDVKSIHKKLVKLYSRRSAVENLIQCLESYAACQAKDGSRARLRNA